ncbi:hypothetical protein P8C59_000261 [Phyllachora maydis]|uniref:BHLH domain-containing protein n=1 Tax=Phyllachora maydis TaxID=1825666 RepID=A0AAD9M7B7_9PEZI|nr:hypothetical protein P8C59_000261 [Phyllachora maydis]
MGSTQPSDVNLPFGYTYDPSQDFLYMDVPEPAPGQPLLSDNDRHALSSFFDDMTADNYSTTSFGEGLNFSDDWLSLPPQFMGHATSFGQQPPPPISLEAALHGLPGTLPDMTIPTTLMPPPPPPPPSQPPQQVLHSEPITPIEQQHPSADVLAAATLLQNVPISRTNCHAHEPLFSPSSSSPMGQQLGHMRHHSTGDYRQTGRRVSQPQAIDSHETAFVDMMFGATTQAPIAAAPRTQTSADVQWGSDSNFARTMFLPLSERESSEALEKERLVYMGCLEVSPSATTTRPSSPAQRSPLKLKTSLLGAAGLKKEEAVRVEPPRKRRKSKAKDVDGEVEDELEPSPATATAKSSMAARKRKSKVEGASGRSPVGLENEPTAALATTTTATAALASTTTTTTATATTATTAIPGKRRKSTAAGIAAAGKQPRENLSESQKRENHIKSEQKRRTVIKEGFDDLCEIVPGLKGGGFSKSMMLSMAAEWLEDMLQGNAILSARVVEVEGE